MPTLIEKPKRIEAAGNKPKLIDEYVGRVNSRTTAASVAHMRSPGGWQEPGQTPQFDEFTVVLRGMLRVEYAGGALDVHAGQAVIAHKGEWVRYSTPESGGRRIHRRLRARVLAGHRAARQRIIGRSWLLQIVRAKKLSSAAIQGQASARERSAPEGVRHKSGEA